MGVSIHGGCEWSYYEKAVFMAYTMTASRIRKSLPWRSKKEKNEPKKSPY